VLFRTRIRKTRPVYLDTTAMRVLAPYVAYRTDGYVGEVVEGKPGPRPAGDIGALASEVDKSDAADGLGRGTSRRLVWKTIYAIHERAHLELAKAYALRHDLGAAVEQIRLANEANPVDAPALAKVKTLSPHDAEAFILTL